MGGAQAFKHKPKAHALYRARTSQRSVRTTVVRGPDVGFWPGRVLLVMCLLSANFGDPTLALGQLGLCHCFNVREHAHFNKTLKTQLSTWPSWARLVMAPTYTTCEPHGLKQLG
eukprot:575637-Pyramimonas_sp.AAC.1